MLIVPLHRRMTWANAPLVTFVLVLLNCIVFFFLQSGDDRVLREASDYYAQAQLGRVEFPAYAQWLQDHDGDARRVHAMQVAPPSYKLALIESDEKFLADLHGDRVIVPASEAYAAWRDKRAEFERIRDSAFTARHALRFSHLEPARMSWAMFMHGGFGHLFGNMIFLLVLGLLVEGALGPWWFLGLYLAGGYGATLTTLAWHSGDTGYALGASGAIAALMGAYCVIWGLRRVRVFYWFFVVFDYVKVPALVLLPFWFGWQVFNLLVNGGAHVGFDAHAGGIACGAALAYVLRRSGRVREDFVEEDAREEQRSANVHAYEQAMAHIGKLEISKARVLLERIDSEEPGQLRVLSALYRCARYGGTPVQLDAAATRVLEFPAKTAEHFSELKSVYADYRKACADAPRLAPAVLLRLVQPLLRAGDEAGAEALLRDVGKRAPTAPALAAAWFAFALRAPEGSAPRRERLEYLAQNFAASEYAGKAKFLLQQG